MHSKNNKRSSLPSSHHLFLFSISSQSPFSSLFFYSPLIPFFSLSIFSLLSSFHLLISLSLSHHASFPLASYLFASSCFTLLFCPFFFLFSRVSCLLPVLLLLPTFLQLSSPMAAYFAFFILYFLLSIFITSLLIPVFLILFYFLLSSIFSFLSLYNSSSAHSR